MRHFIAYHNTKKMGCSLAADGPLVLLTSKPTDHLLHQMIWIVVGDGDKVKQYSLGSVFQVTETAPSTEENFKREVSGPGHEFAPPVPIKERPWFREILRVTGNFGLGVQEVKDEEVISGLIEIATQAGFNIPD